MATDRWQALAPELFAKAVTELIVSQGYRMEQTRATAAGGIEISAADATPIKGSRIIVRAQKDEPEEAVEEAAVRKLYGAVVARGFNKGIFITTAEFTSPSRQFARGKPIELVDGAQLEALLRKVGIAVGAAAAGRAPLFSDFQSILKDLADWERAEPLPYPLHLKATASEVWRGLDVVGRAVRRDDPKFLLLAQDYYKAAYYLLKEAQYRPEAKVIPVRALILDRLQELTQAVAERERLEPKVTRPLEEKWAAEHAREWLLALCMNQLTPLCLKHWWKPTLNLGLVVEAAKPHAGYEHAYASFIWLNFDDPEAIIRIARGTG